MRECEIRESEEERCDQRNCNNQGGVGNCLLLRWKGDVCQFSARIFEVIDETIHDVVLVIKNRPGGLIYT